MKSKRQKLKEKKRRQKEKRAEAALGQSPSLVLPDEMERERVWMLDRLQLTPEDVHQAIAGDPSGHPMLHRLVLTTDALLQSTTSRTDIPSAARDVLRRLALSPAPLTHEAFHNALYPPN